MVSRSQQETDGPTTRTNFDKASLRRMYRKPFEHAIAAQSAVVGRDQSILQYGADAGSNAVQVFARKRPLFPAESETDYDIVNVDAGRTPSIFPPPLIQNQPSALHSQRPSQAPLSNPQSPFHSLTRMSTYRSHAVWQGEHPPSSTVGCMPTCDVPT